MWIQEGALYCVCSSRSDTIRRSIDQGQMTSTGAVFIDLRKVFYTVDHFVLLRKLHSYVRYRKHGIKVVRKLSNKSETAVSCQNVLSEAETVTSGVPQGSILALGPLLFILLANELLSKRTINCSMLMYAGDTVLFYSSNDVKVIEKITK